MDIEYIVQSAQISSCLEVSGYPKPGNVHRIRDFPDMCFEDFIISGVVIGESIRKAAIKGREFKDSNDFSCLGLGEIILEAVSETDKWVSNNTNLGIIMLSVPIAASAGISDSFSELRKNINRLILESSPKDTINLYDAINIAQAGGLGSQENYDVSNEDSKKEILENNTNLYDVFKISSPWDYISRELTNSMPISFDIGQKTFRENKDKYGYNTATLKTFLSILSLTEDSLISRKYGNDIAISVSKKAKKVLDSDITSKDGKLELENFDNYLFQNKLNPGTTADLTASSIFLDFLYKGFNNNF